MEDTVSLKRDVKRKSTKSNQVNRIVSLFEIPRPNKQRSLQRTNSLPATRRPASSTSEEEGRNTLGKTHFGGLYSQSGRVKRIKEEIEEKNKTEQNNITPPKYIRKKTRSRRRNCDSEGGIIDVLAQDKREIMDNLMDISRRIGKIEIVTEDVAKSDTELEIAFDNVSEEIDNVFQSSEENKEEITMRDKLADENCDIVSSSRLSGDTVISTLSSDTVINRLSSDNLDEHQNFNEDQMKLSYGTYVVGSGVVSYSRSTSSDSELDDRESQQNEAEAKDQPVDVESNCENHIEVENNVENHRDEDKKENEQTCFWLKSLYNHTNQMIDKNNYKDSSEIEDQEEIPEDTNNLEVDSITWWKNKSFVQLNNNNTLPRQTDNDENHLEGNDENNAENPEYSTNTLEKGRRFIKNQTARQSQRLNRRRTGILMKANVKELTKHFENFKDAAEKGETEHYRRSFIDEMDKEIENMRIDGFEDDFHLSVENLTALSYENDDDVNQRISDKENGNEATNSYEEPNTQFLTMMCISSQSEEVNDSDDTDDDPFGETLFSEDLEHGLYYVESYNADGKELIMCSVQVDRQSVDLSKLDEVKSKSQSNLLAQQDDERTLILMGAAEAENRFSLNDSNGGTESNNGTDSKRTTIYSTTSGDSFDDRVTDDEGIDIETSSNSYGYSSARRETYCDDHGIVRIERVAPYPKHDEEPPEYMDTMNHYYEINPKQEEEENYYDSIRQEHEIPVSVSEVKKETLHYIVEEIKATERKYVEDMKRVLHQYKPFLEERCPDKVPVVFGNMESIYLKQIEFLETLDNSEDDIKEVVQAFIDFEDLFKIYPRYFKNTPKANIAVKELADIFKEKQEQLNDKLSLSAYLLTPLQRLGKYKLFLENITKQMKKEGKSTGSVQMALDIIKKYMSKGNDAVAIASILHSPLHYKDYGSFVSREKFTLWKPKRMELVVFLFQEVVVFTTEDQRNMEQFNYWQSIKTDDLRIATFDDTTIHLTDYTKTKRRNTSKYTFVLDAKTQKLKSAWKNEIEEILWKQLKKVKENTLKEYQSGKKVPKKQLTRNRVKSTGTSVFYIE